jgi:hypothetical protein
MHITQVVSRRQGSSSADRVLMCLHLGHMQVNGRVAMLAIVALTALEQTVGVPFF